MLDVVCFGEILWDVFETSARGREPIARTFRRELGGAPANVATGLARLGVRVGGRGRRGARPLRRRAASQHLAGDGVDVRFVQALPNRTGLTFVVRDARGEPEFLFYRHESADLAMRAEHVVPAMGRARWVLVGTSTLMTPRRSRAATDALPRGRRARRARTCSSTSTCARTSGADRRTMQRAIAALARTRVAREGERGRPARSLRRGGRPPLARASCPAGDVARDARRAARQRHRRARRGDASRPCAPGASTPPAGATPSSPARSPRSSPPGAVPARPAWRNPAVWRAALARGAHHGQKGRVAAGRGRRSRVARARARRSSP